MSKLRLAPHEITAHWFASFEIGIFSEYSTPFAVFLLKEPLFRIFLVPLHL